eukprot:NODE_429_length_7612_cov_0.787968.p5 type:complete len:297 gc:universal NODE_429_length_7612_cov_0.787968:4635-3745(-)
MPLVKEYKTTAYYKRYQTKYRRRREGKTDYYQRKKLVIQAKNKYNAAKYRLVVRFTNKHVIAQIVKAKVVGDVVLAQANSSELEHFGIKAGLGNWPAAYCTGLLVARRLLKKLKLTQFEGQEATGEFYLVEADGEVQPFKCFLDVGLRRTTTGSKIFAALKGAVDGGLYVPHSENRFPGFDSESKELETEVLKKYIFGGHISDYMTMLKEEDPEKYKKQFSKFIKEKVEPAGLEALYKNAHSKIRANPDVPKAKVDIAKAKALVNKNRKRPLSLAERKNKVAQKKASYKKAFDAAE